MISSASLGIKHLSPTSSPSSGDIVLEVFTKTAGSPNSPLSLLPPPSIPNFSQVNQLARSNRQTTTPYWPLTGDPGCEVDFFFLHCLTQCKKTLVFSFCPSIRCNCCDTSLSLAKQVPIIKPLCPTFCTCIEGSRHLACNCALYWSKAVYCSCKQSLFNYLRFLCLCTHDQF